MKNWAAGAVGSSDGVKSDGSKLKGNYSSLLRTDRFKRSEKANRACPYPPRLSRLGASKSFPYSRESPWIHIEN